MKIFPILFILFLLTNCVVDADTNHVATSIAFDSGADNGKLASLAALENLRSPDLIKQAHGLEVLKTTKDPAYISPILNYMATIKVKEGSEGATVQIQLRRSAIEALESNSGIKFPPVDPRNFKLWNDAINSFRTKIGGTHDPKATSKNPESTNKQKNEASNDPYQAKQTVQSKQQPDTANHTDVSNSQDGTKEDAIPHWGKMLIVMASLAIMSISWFLFKPTKRN